MVSGSSYIPATAAYGRWQAAASRAAAGLPSPLRSTIALLFVADDSPPSPFATGLARLLAGASLVAPVLIMVWALLRHGTRSWAPFADDGTLAVGTLYGLIALSWAVLEAPRLLRVLLPRWTFLLWARWRGIAPVTLGLAVSHTLLPTLADEESQARTARWLLLTSSAEEAQQEGEIAARLLRPGVAPEPLTVDLLAVALEWLPRVVYQCGLIVLWLPAWHLLLRAAGQEAAGPLPCDLPALVTCSVVALGVHLLGPRAVRLWLGCDPGACQHLSEELSALARARRLRAVAFRVLTSESGVPLSVGELAADEDWQQEPSTWIGRLTSWLVSDS